MPKLKSFECVRINFIVHYVLLVLMGVAMILLAYFFYHGWYYTDFQNLDGYENLIIAALATGALIIVVAIFGFFGARMMNPCMLIVCFTLLLLVFGVQITIGTFASSIRNEVVEFIRPRLLAFLKEPKNDSKFDAIQSTLNCCGVYEPGDWRTFGNHTNDSVLDSCCDVSGCRTDRPTCLAESLRFGDNVFLITCSICFSFGVLQLFVMASTMVMICWIRKYDKIDGTEA